MFRVLAINSPVNYILYLFFFAAALSLHWLWNPVETFTIKHSEPLSAVIFGFLDKIPYSVLITQILGALLSLLSAISLNRTIAASKLPGARSYSVGMIFLLLMCVHRHFTFISPELVAVFFTIQLLNKIVVIMKEEKPRGSIFDLGFLSGITVLFYMPSWWMLIFCYVALVVIRPFSLREWLTTLAGFIGPIFLAFSFYFWFDKQNVFLSELINLPNFEGPDRIISVADTAGAVWLVAVFLITALSLPRILFTNVIQVRQFTGLLLTM
ncbi:MAG: hypothetical protein NZ522_09315, partial [Chitinophagales bacterium]|nr:hypothetical protein [Chitinophagales bacterium]